MASKEAMENNLSYNFSGVVYDITNIKDKNSEIDINRNFKVLIDNFNSCKNVPVQNNMKYVKELLEFSKRAKSKLELDVWIQVGNSSLQAELGAYVAYLFQSIDYIESLAGDFRAKALEQPDYGILSILRNATQFDGVFFTGFWKISNLLVHETQILLSSSQAIAALTLQMFFIIEQYAFLAEHYCKKYNLAAVEENLSCAFLVFKQLKSQLVGKRGFIDTALSYSTSTNGPTTEFLHNKKKIINELIFPKFVPDLLDIENGTGINRLSLTPLHMAAFQGDFKEIKRLLDKSLCHLNSKDCEGFTALHCAVLAGNTVVEHFLAYDGVNVNVQSQAGLTALHIAVITNSIEIVQTLLKHPEVDVNTATLDGWTSLHIAVSMQHIEIVAELVKTKDLNINAKLFCRITPLHIAVKLNDEHLLNMLLEKGADLEAITENGLSAQQIAQKFNCFNALKLIEEFLVKTQDALAETSLMNLATKDPVKNTTSMAHIDGNVLQEPYDDASEEMAAKFFQAVVKADFGTIKSFIANGIDVAKVQKSGKNVFDFAVLSGNLEVLKYFLQIETTEVMLERLLFKTAELGLAGETKFLLEEKGLNPQLKDSKKRSLLCAAISGENFELVKYLIDNQGVPVVSSTENCPLCSAIEINDLNMVKYFLNKGLKVNGVGEEKRPILVAAEKASYDLFVYLLGYGASIDTKNNGKGVFDYAAIGGNAAVLRYLVREKKYKLNTTISGSGLSTFIQVARAGTLSAIKYFVVEHNSSVRDKGPLNGTVLHEAAFNRNLDVIRYFVESCNLDPKERDDQSFIPMFYAAQENNLAAVKYFVSDQNMGIHLRDKYGRTVLHLAAMHGHLDVLRYLVEEQKAVLNAKDNDGFTPLFLAAQNINNFEVVKYLLKKCSDISGLNKDEANILHLAARFGNVEIIQFLIEAKHIDINSKDATGQTPIFYAAYEGQLDAVKYFVDSQKININYTDDIKRTVLFSAVFSSNINVVKYLVERGADLNITDESNYLPVKHAKDKVYKYLYNKTY